MPRPKQVPPRVPLTPLEIRSASYLGSSEHKASRWWGGLPGAFVGPDGSVRRPKRQLTTLCPLRSVADRDEATGWVRLALSQAHYRYYEGDKRYPKHIWHIDEVGRYWFGFCINGIAGTYKGWSIDEVERRAIFG